MAKNLAEYLGIEDPQDPETPVAPAPSPRLSRREFAREILNSHDYRESLFSRIRMQTLPAQVECLLYHYAYGKPTDVVEVREQSTALENLTPEQLDKRELLLLQRLREVRQLKTTEEGSVH